MTVDGCPVHYMDGSISLWIPYSCILYRQARVRERHLYNYYSWNALGAHFTAWRKHFTVKLDMNRNMQNGSFMSLSVQHVRFLGDWVYVQTSTTGAAEYKSIFNSLGVQVAATQRNIAREKLTRNKNAVSESLMLFHARHVRTTSANDA